MTDLRSRIDDTSSAFYVVEEKASESRIQTSSPGLLGRLVADRKTRTPWRDRYIASKGEYGTRVVQSLQATTESKSTSSLGAQVRGAPDVRTDMMFKRFYEAERVRVKAGVEQLQAESLNRSSKSSLNTPREKLWHLALCNSHLVDTVDVVEKYMDTVQDGIEELQRAIRTNGEGFKPTTKPILFVFPRAWPNNAPKQPKALFGRGASSDKPATQVATDPINDDALGGVGRGQADSESAKQLKQDKQPASRELLLRLCKTYSDLLIEFNTLGDNGQPGRQRFYPRIYTLPVEVVYAFPEEFTNTRSTVHELSVVEKAAESEINRIKLEKLPRIILSKDPLLKRAGFSEAVLSYTGSEPTVVRLDMPDDQSPELRVIVSDYGENDFDVNLGDDDGGMESGQDDDDDEVDLTRGGSAVVQGSGEE